MASSRRRSGPPRWSYSAGERPNTVTVFEKKPGGVLHVRVWDPTARGGIGNWVRRSLKHRDRERAEQYAREQALKLLQGTDALVNGRVTLAQVLAAYERHRTPRKSATEQKADRRRMELWQRVLGGGRDPHSLKLGEWERFIVARRSGSIDARGRAVAEGKRRPVRARPVEADCRWLRLAFNWAVKWRTDHGYLMRENPVRGFETPREKNPMQPVATQDRYEATRAVSDQVMMQVSWGERLEERRSHVSELLDIVNGTGRRLSAVCQLCYHDLRLNQGPHGSIRWPADTDKQGRETVVPIGPRVRQALDRVLRERPGSGAAPLFPSPETASEPMSRHLADKWLREAEKLAHLEPLRGSLWHAYRRKWATERKHLPDVDVAAAGGWKSLQAMKTSYQQTDRDTMLRVVLGAGELREAP